MQKGNMMTRTRKISAQKLTRWRREGGEEMFRTSFIDRAANAWLASNSDPVLLSRGSVAVRTNLDFLKEQWLRVTKFN